MNYTQFGIHKFSQHRALVKKANTVYNDELIKFSTLHYKDLYKKVLASLVPDGGSTDAHRQEAIKIITILVDNEMCVYDESDDNWLAVAGFDDTIVDTEDFESWKHEVDKICRGHLGDKFDDLPELPYRDWHDDGLVPAEVFEIVIEDLGF